MFGDADFMDESLDGSLTFSAGASGDDAGEVGPKRAEGSGCGWFGLVGGGLGKVGVQAEYTEGTAQRLAIENTALKQRVRQLTDQNRSIEQKLQAARSNNRFLDKRLADLEAALVEAQLPPGPVPDQRPSRMG